MSTEQYIQEEQNTHTCMTVAQIKKSIHLMNNYNIQSNTPLTGTQKKKVRNYHSNLNAIHVLITTHWGLFNE